MRSLNGQSKCGAFSCPPKGSVCLESVQHIILLPSAGNGCRAINYDLWEVILKGKAKWGSWALSPYCTTGEGSAIIT